MPGWGVKALSRRHNDLIFKFTVDKFDQTPDARGDLISGQIQDVASDEVEPAGARVDQPDAAPRTRSPIRPDHEFVVQNLSASLISALRDGNRRVLVRHRLKLRAGDTARPDICVLRGAEALSSKTRRQHDAIELIVEVSSGALQYEFDQLARYALAGVPEVWIVDLQRQRLLVHQIPSGNSYAKRQVLVAPERMGLLRVPNVELKVAWIFAERE